MQEHVVSAVMIVKGRGHLVYVHELLASKPVPYVPTWGSRAQRWKTTDGLSAGGERRRPAGTEPISFARRRVIWGYHYPSMLVCR